MSRILFEISDDLLRLEAILAEAGGEITESRNGGDLQPLHLGHKP
jgi:hypothetical protein